MIWSSNSLLAFFSIYFLTGRFRPVSSFQPFLGTSLDYAASPVDFVHLIRVESQLVLKLQEFLENSTHLNNVSELNLSHLKTYVNDFESTLLKDLGLDLKLFSKLVVRNVIDLQGLGEDAAKHPFKNYRTIRRLVKQIKELEAAYKNTVITTEIEKHQKLQPFPQESDLSVASLSILRLNQLYKLPVSEFLVGKLGDLKTNCFLSPKHLKELGTIALENEFFSIAVDFFAFLSEHFKNTKQHEEIEHLLKEAIQKHDQKILEGVGEDEMQPDSGPFFFGDLLHNSSHNNFKDRTPVTLEMLLEHVDEESIDEGDLADFKFQTIQASYAFEKLCRGESLKVSNLRCYTTTNPHPTFILHPLKVEIHNQDPLLVQYYDVVDEREIEELKAEVKGEMRMSRTIKANNEVKDELGQTSRFRTSSNAWITDHLLPKFSYLTQRIGRMIEVNATGWLSTENLQIAAYSPGGHYVPHTDAVFEETVLDTLEPTEFLRGDRLITFMIYLSDVERGGATAFPHLKTAVQPAKGSAVVWYNLHSDGTINRQTLHGGCSVIYGVKWIANKWVRINDQMFLKKCPASRSSWGLAI